MDPVLHEWLERIESKTDQALGHIAVLNDEHVQAERWRTEVNLWRGKIDARLTIFAVVGALGTMASGAVAVAKFFLGG